MEQGWTRAQAGAHGPGPDPGPMGQAWPGPMTRAQARAHGPGPDPGPMGQGHLAGPGPMDQAIISEAANAVDFRGGRRGACRADCSRPGVLEEGLGTAGQRAIGQKKFPYENQQRQFDWTKIPTFRSGLGQASIAQTLNAVPTRQGAQSMPRLRRKRHL